MKLDDKITELGLDGIVITNPIDLYYLTGLRLSAGSYVVTNEGPHLFVDGRYIEVAKAGASCPVSLGKPSLTGRIGFDSTVMTFAEVGGFEGVEMVAIPRLMQQVRAVKRPDEIDKLAGAAELACRGGQYMLTQLSEGVSEIEISRLLEIFWLENGGEKSSFAPIVAFGENAALPHHRPGLDRLESGKIVLLDWGVQRELYQSDMTRCVFFGAVDPEIEKIYQIVERALQASLEACRTGITLAQLDGTARSIIEEAGYTLPHSLGHGVGLDVHEYPVIRNAEGALKANMVVTLEPGIYLPGLGGVRLEETVVVGDSGCESLTRGLPRDPRTPLG